MNEILQQRIDEAAKEMSHNKMSFWEDCNYSTKDIEEIIYDACKLVSGYALQNQWISVEEALPKYEKDVLVRNADDDFFVTYRSEDSVDADEHGFVNYHPLKITHWMPIPELKGGEK